MMGFPLTSSSKTFEIPDRCLVAGNCYRLTYGIRHDALTEGDEFAVFMNDQEHIWNFYINVTRGPMAESGWKLCRYEFTAPSLNTANVILAFYFYFNSYYGGNNVRAWVDDVSLIRID